jgi:hypothetical protein
MRRHLLVIGTAVWLAACGNDATSTVERGGRFELVQGPPTLALPGYPVADSMKVRLVDRDGEVMAHTSVLWLAQHGSVSGSSQTDAEGIAAAEWTLGMETGAQSLTVRTLQDSSLSLSTTAEFFRADKLSTLYAGGCAVRAGDLWCWGAISGRALTSRRSVSRLPIGGSFFPANARPARVTQGETFVDVRVTNDLICGLRASGAVGCLPGSWGGDSVPSVQAVSAPPLRDLAGGGAFSAYMCGLSVSDSRPWCWTSDRQATPVAGAPAMLDLGGMTGSNPSTNAGCGRQADSTAWCWGRPAPLADGIAVTAAQLAIDGNRGCARRADGEVWCWTFGFGSTPPVATKVADGITTISADDGSLLGVRGGRLIRWDRHTQASWSMTPVPTVASRLFGGLPANVAYGVSDASAVVFVGGEHYFTNNSGYYNGEYWPLQPVE